MSEAMSEAIRTAFVIGMLVAWSIVHGGCS